MSNTYAIGAVTGALQQLLDVSIPLPGDPVPDIELADAFCSTKPLDVARPVDEQRNQLNLFLFQIQHHAGFRNMDMLGNSHEGERAQQPLALILYYVLTAYGRNDDDVMAHRMLGRAMSILHDNSTLTRTSLQAGLAGSDLWQQVERVRIRPHPLGTEEISKLWTGFSKAYRISIGYEVSVVLIESTKPKIVGLPVLSRGKPVGTPPVEPGPRVSANLELPYPLLERFEVDKKRPSVRLGELLTIHGHNIGGTPLTAHFNHRLFSAPLDLTPAGTHDANHVQLQIPNTPAAWPAGLYSVTVDVKNDQLRTTNVLSVPLAPTITSITKNAASSSTLAVLDIAVTPSVWEQQKVTLLAGDREVIAEPRIGVVSTLQFQIPDPPTGHIYLRLRVDGVDSLLVTDFTTTPAKYDETQAIDLP